MKTTLITFALFAFFAVNATAAHGTGIDVDRQMHSIGMKETGLAWDGRPGRNGELSCYQITPAVWRDRMPGVPLSEIYFLPNAQECARRHIRWISAQLLRRGYRVTPGRVALVWNVGLEGALARNLRLNPYAQSVANLYADTL